MNEKVARVKEEVKEGAREVERLRVLRGEVEKAVDIREGGEEDARVGGLYDWFVFLLLFSISASSP